MVIDESKVHTCMSSLSQVPESDKDKDGLCLPMRTRVLKGATAYE